MSEIPEALWGWIQKRLDYDDAELEKFKTDPRNAHVLATGMEMATKTIVFEVVEASGCNGEHRVGDRIFFTGDGLLITGLSPKRICTWLFPVMSQAIFAMHELWYAGHDPNGMRFRRGGCWDVGLACGGWGHVVIEASVVDRAEAERLAAS